ncbi:MAG: LysM peptidoglycan-binding domain-containing protein [bacterium]|nr:LysM peptidoglycan-binding domain-containing protein [bacterium]
MTEDIAKKWDDSLISMGLGALVVVVSGILLFNYFNNQTPNLIRDQGQKAVVVSSSMPAVSENAGPTATSSGKIVAQAVTVTPRVTASPSPKITASPKATQTPKATVSTAPTATPKTSSIAQARPEATPATGGTTLPAMYTVQPGDSLWAVSQKFYGSGYEWKQIAAANKLTGTYRLEKGQVLNLPRVELISATSTEKAQIAQASVAPSAKPSASVSPAPAVGGASVAPASTAPSIPTGAITHTVTQGDTLWRIAADKCNNGYLWSSIAKQNKLLNPGVIHNGNTFTFTCQ